MELVLNVLLLIFNIIMDALNVKLTKITHQANVQNVLQDFQCLKDNAITVLLIAMTAIQQITLHKFVLNVVKALFQSMALAFQIGHVQKKNQLMEKWFAKHVYLKKLCQQIKLVEVAFGLTLRILIVINALLMKITKKLVLNVLKVHIL